MNTKDRLLNLISTGLGPDTLDAGSFHIFLDDPENLNRLIGFLATYERCESQPIIVADLPEVTLPPWSSGRVLRGTIRRPAQFNFITLMSSLWFHPHQTEDEYKDMRPSGPEILRALVQRYDDSADKEGYMYDVATEDAIHGHFGLSELSYLESAWSIAPKSFQMWAAGKTLYGWRDAVRSAEGGISVPAFHCSIQTCCSCNTPLKPYVSWEVIRRTGGRFDVNRPALWVPVAK